jgi:hypothetical protein
MQDPKKKEVGEMGKPSLKAKFEAAMQKQYKSRPENKATVKEPVNAPSKKKYKYILMMSENKVPSKNKYKDSLMMSENKLD